MYRPLIITGLLCLLGSLVGCAKSFHFKPATSVMVYKVNAEKWSIADLDESDPTDPNPPVTLVKTITDTQAIINVLNQNKRLTADDVPKGVHYDYVLVFNSKDDYGFKKWKYSTQTGYFYAVLNISNVSYQITDTKKMNALLQ